ncbi:hypothetical protein MBLNU457_6138t1 [Dothideomycetes sp. NU457]
MSDPDKSPFQMTATELGTEILLFFQNIHPAAAAVLLLPISMLILFGIMQLQLQYDESKKNARQGKNYQTIDRQPNFDLHKTPRATLRPFKPSTSTSQPSDFNTFLPLDSSYASSLETRRSHLRTHLTSSLAATPASWDPVAEFHEWLTGIYLPHRYPSMFILMAAPAPVAKPDKGRGLAVRNKVINETVPVTAPAEADKALAALGANVDADFVFLVPNRAVGAHCVEAYVATEMRLEGRLGKAVGDVGIEGLSERLEKSFAALPGRRMVVRETWAVVCGDLVLSGDTVEGDASDTKWVGDKEAFEEIEGMRLLSLALRTEGGQSVGQGSQTVDLKDARLRCERQTLHRLPETNGLVFASKTYYYGLDEIKAEGNGEALAAAIDGLGEPAESDLEKGNAALADKVKRYLRS